MFASSGEITEPCAVPLPLALPVPSSATPAFNHLRIRRINAPVTDTMFDEFNEPVVAHRIERRYDRLPTTKTFRSRPLSHVNGIRLKGTDFLSSGA